MTLTPDLLGRVRQRTFSDGTPQIVYDYDANNNLTGISRGGVVWSYVYNSLNLPEQETLTVELIYGTKVKQVLGITLLQRFGFGR